MFWLVRPPFVRWVAAALVLIAAAALDMAGRATEPFPFVTRPVARGEPIGPGTVEWRDVPVGLLGDAAGDVGVAARDLGSGEPLLASAVTGTDAVPGGWWAVPIDLPDTARTGMPVRLIAIEPSLDVEGVVAQPPQTGAFAVTSPGLVAVPPGVAGIVAQATSGGRLVVLLGT